MSAMPQTESNWKFPFFTIWIGQAFSLLGSGVVQFALVWWLTIETNSATVLAGATLVAILPQVVLGPLVGPLVDRWSRRLILIVADGIIALSTLWLIYSFTIGAMAVWHVYVVMFVRAVAGAFHFPTMQASTTLMVPKEQLSRVAGLNQTLQGVTNIASPALGALLLQVFELRAALAVDIVTAALAILPLFFILIPQPTRTAATETASGRSSFWQDMRAGVHYVWNWPGMRAILAMAMLINFLLTPAFSLMPLLVRTQIGGDAGLLATLEALFGVGVIVGGLALSLWGGFRRRILTSMMGLIGLGAGTLLFGATPPTAILMALGSALLIGSMISITNGSIMAVQQSIIAPDMQGRVMSLDSSLSTAMTPLSLIVAGPIADALGVRIWYVASGVVCGLMGLAGFFIPAIVQLEDNHMRLPQVSSEAPSVAAAAPDEPPRAVDLAV